MIRKPSTTLEELRSQLIQSEGRISSPGFGFRIAPSSFDPNDPTLTAYPRPLDWRWDSCERFFRLFKAHTVLLRLPLFWQVESMLNTACRAVGVAIFANEQENMPVGAAAIVSARANVVLTETEDAARFASFLFEKNKTLPDAWFLIHRIDLATWEIPASIPKDSHIAQEVHLFPGVPILTQCETLASSRSSSFHIAEGYMCDIDVSGTFFSSEPTDPAPFTRLKLSYPLRETGSCECGKVILEQDL